MQPSAMKSQKTLPRLQRTNTKTGILILSITAIGCMVLRKQYGIATTLVGARYDVRAKFLPNEPMRDNNSLYDIHLPIAYEIVRGMLHQEIFVEPRAAKCDKLGTERISPLAFQQSGVLDFNTRITSSVNIAMLGDSVGIQFGQALLESAGGTLENFIVLKKLHKTFNLMSILRTSRGNGTFANFRITGLLGEKYKNQSRRLPNNRRK